MEKKIIHTSFEKFTEEYLCEEDLKTLNDLISKNFDGLLSLSAALLAVTKILNGDMENIIKRYGKEMYLSMQDTLTRSAMYFIGAKAGKEVDFDEIYKKFTIEKEKIDDEEEEIYHLMFENKENLKERIILKIPKKTKLKIDEVHEKILKSGLLDNLGMTSLDLENRDNNYLYAFYFLFFKWLDYKKINYEELEFTKMIDLMKEFCKKFTEKSMKENAKKYLKDDDYEIITVH